MKKQQIKLRKLTPEEKRRKALSDRLYAQRMLAYKIERNRDERELLTPVDSYMNDVKSGFMDLPER